MNKKQEEFLQLQVCAYLRTQYPDVIFICDIASGMKLTIGSAVKAKKMRSRRGQPDLFIAESLNGYSGLFIELKKNGEKIFDKFGNYKKGHIEEQAIVLTILKSKGYWCDFAIGFNEAKKIIDDYLK